MSGSRPDGGRDKAVTDLPGRDRVRAGEATSKDV